MNRSFKARRLLFTVIAMTVVCQTGHAGNRCVQDFVARLSSTAEGEAKLRPISVRPLDIEMIKSLKKTKASFYYFKDDNHRIYILDHPFKGADAGVSIFQLDTQTQHDIRIVEYGQVRSGGQFNELKFDHEMKFEPETRAKDEGMPIDCLSLLQKQSKAGNVVWNFLKANTLYQVGVELVFNPLATPEDKKRMAADIFGGMVTGALGTWAGTKIVQNVDGFRQYAGPSILMAVGSTALQNGINHVSGADSVDHPDTLSAFNWAHRIVMFYPSYQINRWFADTLPGLLYERCRKGDPIEFWMRPDSLRMAERVGQAVIYYGPREVLIKYESKKDGEKK